MKFFTAFIFALIFAMMCFFGCGDEGVSTLQDISVPSAPVVITGVPPEIQEMLWGDWDTLLDDVLKQAEFDRQQDVDDPVGTRVHLRKLCLFLEQRDYYTKYIDAGGIAIMGDNLVADRFFYAAQEMIFTITAKRPELREALSPKTRFRMVLVDPGPGPAAIPEVNNDYYDKTAGIAFCGRGSVPDADNFFCVTPVWVHPVKTDEIWGMTVLVHEFAHAMHLRAINKLDPTFQGRLEAAYAVAKANAVDNLEDALRLNKYGKRTPEMLDVREYWAYGVQAWFFDVTRPDPLTDFQEKDPLLYALLDEWLPFTYLAPIEWKW